MDGFKRGRGILKKYLEEMIREDITQFQLIQEITFRQEGVNDMNQRKRQLSYYSSILVGVVLLLQFLSFDFYFLLFLVLRLSYYFTVTIVLLPFFCFCYYMVVLFYLFIQVRNPKASPRGKKLRKRKSSVEGLNIFWSLSQLQFQFSSPSLEDLMLLKWSLMKMMMVRIMIEQ